jgi:hypothetical protein
VLGCAEGEGEGGPRVLYVPELTRQIIRYLPAYPGGPTLTPDRLFIP